MSWSPQGIKRLKVEVIGSRSLTLELLQIRLGGEREFIKNAASGCIRERLERELADLQRAMQAKQVEIANLPARIEEARSRVQEIEAAIAALHTQTQAEKDTQKLEAEIARTKKKLEKLKVEKSSASQRHKAMVEAATKTENNSGHNSMFANEDA